MRLATTIPASHWRSIGYSPLQATAMERLTYDIKTLCDGGDETEINLRQRGSLHTVDQILLYNELMLPHWQKFANVLRGRDSMTRVHIRGISLPPPVLDIIFPALQSMNNLIFLTLSRNGLGSEGFIQLSSFLNGNTRLQKLVVINNVIDDLSVAGSLSNALLNHVTLKNLALSKCGLNNIPILEEILEGCKEMECLGIVNDNLGSEGVSLIANFLRSNRTAIFLQFHGNKITDDDALALATLPRENTNLRIIDLKNNDITEEGEKQLLKVLYDPTSMDSIVNSNHLCIPYTFDVEKSSIAAQRPLETAVFAINADDDISVKQKIKKKVVLALCGVDGGLFDLSHFNDLPLQLMPRALELIQKHTTIRSINNTPVQLEKDALSRLFHTLLGWELPVLFENLNNPSTNAGKRKRRKTRR